MEYSISRVKGKANLFNKYIHDSEKELNKRKISKPSRKLSSEPYPVENLLEEYLKLIKKRNKISFSSCMKNERKTKQRTSLAPMTKVLNTIEQNIDLLVDKFVEIFKVKPSSNFQSKDLKLSNNNKISRKVLMKNKKRNSYYVNCNKLSKFSGLNKRTIRPPKNYPYTYTLEELQSLKRIIELGNIDNNTFMDWNKYGQHFKNTGESQIIPHDSMVDTNKAYLNSMSFISHFTNITPPGMNCIVFYNKENKNYDNYGNINFLNKPINSFDFNEENKLPFKLDKTYNGKPKMPEYLVYTGAIGNKAKTKGKNGNGKQKPKRKKKEIKEAKPKQESGGFCFICKRIKTCLCGTKPEVVSESPSAEVYTAPTGMEEMVDPEAYYDINENEFAKQTYVYSALSEPNYDKHNEMMGHEKTNKPVVCSIDITGSDTGNIVIKDGSKLHNLGFRINDWYLKPVSDSF